MSSYWSSLRKAVDFGILLLLVTLQNPLIVYNSCLADSFRFAVTAYANNDHLTASFPIFRPLISFSYSIKVATSTRMLLIAMMADSLAWVPSLTEHFLSFPMYKEAVFGVWHVLCSLGIYRALSWAESLLEMLDVTEWFAEMEGLLYQFFCRDKIVDWFSSPALTGVWVGSPCLAEEGSDHTRISCYFSLPVKWKD